MPIFGERIETYSVFLFAHSMEMLLNGEAKRLGNKF